MIRVPGHFGEWLQGRLGPGGPVALVTLPCAALGVTAEAREAPAFALADGGLLGEERARRFLESFGPVPARAVTLTPEMPPGGGAGASTAALLALAAACGIEAAPETLAAACRAAEGAVDPLMHEAPETLLWASREARVLRRLAAPPAVEILGGFWGAAQRTDPADTAFPDIADLVDHWEAALARADRAALAGIATEGARRTTALRGPGDDPTLALARDMGALGVIRAHTGSARGLVFAPGRLPAGAADRLRAEGYASVLAFAAPGPA